MPRFTSLDRAAAGAFAGRPPGHRRVWGFALGYFAFYAPYAALVKAVALHRHGDAAGLSGLALLPAVIAGTAAAIAVIFGLLGWWRHIRWPGAAVFVSGLGTAVIIATTTLLFTFHGVSIMLALVMMRAGVLILAPLVDLVSGRTVRWFSWAALVFSLAAAAVAMSGGNAGQKLPIEVGGCLSLYLAGYALRLPCMTGAAKCPDTTLTRCYLVQEAAVALAALLIVQAIVALTDLGVISSGLRQGFAALASEPLASPAVLIGILYAGLFVCGTLVYLDRRENTFCVPLNRCSSLLAGVLAAYALTWLRGVPPPAASQLVAATLVAAGLLLLSPFHHVLEQVASLAVQSRRRSAAVAMKFDEGTQIPLAAHHGRGAELRGGGADEPRGETHPRPLAAEAVLSGRE